ncbi:MAG: SpoIIE family protein phosphatase [Phycisphaerae bacterium]|nr:SpoIIE family protein phosphatase [Phycisphaerae bacterium]
MARLTDYLDLQTLQQLQDSFTAVSQVPVRICDAAGAPLTPARSETTRSLPPVPDGIAPANPFTHRSDVCEAPILLDGKITGRIVMESGGVPDRDHDGRGPWLLSLMAAMIGRLTDRESVLRERVEQLATLYRLTAEFTAANDLQTVLDTVAKIVVDVIKAKGCMIRMLSEDHKELVIKAVHQLSLGYLNKGPILVEQSQIDREVLTTGKTVYVSDSRNDPRVLYQAEARDEGIVSALVVPMFYKGRPEGVIRVYMKQRHEFDWFEIQLIQAIAAQGAAALVNARLYAEAVAAASIKRQLALAGDVQRHMIPLQPPDIDGLDFGAHYVSCFELGGDFYDFIDLPPDNIGLAICDVSGKGVRASLLMASIRASLRAHATNIYDMSRVLTRVNRDLCDDKLTSDFATLFYGVLDYRTRRFTYANAGHPPPLLLRDNVIQRLETGGGVLGIEPEFRWRFNATVLQRGDVLFMYTDGLSEAMNFHDEDFGADRVEQALRTAVAADYNADGIVKHVLWEMRRFTGLQTRGDDLTMVAMRVV